MNQDEFDYDPAIRNRQIENLLRDIGRRIKSTMPPGYGFALQIFSYEGPEFFYISSAEREGMVKTLQEFLDDQKKRAGK